MDKEQRGAAAQAIGCVSAFVAIVAIGLAFGIRSCHSGSPSQPNSTTRDGLTLTVDRIENTEDAFKIYLTARNGTRDTLNLSIDSNFEVTDDGGNRYFGDPSNSTFPGFVRAGDTRSGYIRMQKPLGERATVREVTFKTVYGSPSIHSVRVSCDGSLPGNRPRGESQRVQQVVAARREAQEKLAEARTRLDGLRTSEDPDAAVALARRLHESFGASTSRPDLSAEARELKVAAVELCLRLAQQKARQFVERDDFAGAAKLIGSVADDIRPQARDVGREKQFDDLREAYRFLADLARQANEK